MSSDYLPWFGNTVEKGRLDRIGRPAYVAGLSVAVAGLVLGAAYGGPVSPLSLYASVLLGGLVYRRARLSYGSEAYGNVLLAGMIGSVLSSLAISGFISLALDLPLISVVWSTAPTLLANLVTVASLGLVGFVGAILASSLPRPSRDSVGVALLVLGAAGFALVQYRMGQLRPDTGSLATPILAEGVYATYQLYGYAGMLAGAVGFVGFVSLLSSRERRRAAAVALVLVAAIVGGIGVGSVGARISHYETAASVTESVSVEVTALNVTDDAVELSIRVHNPSDRAIRMTGAYVRTFNDSRARLAYGAGERVAGEAVVGAGETATATYRIGLSSQGASDLRSALRAGEVGIDGRVTLELEQTGLTAPGVNSGFTVRFDCVAGSDGVRC